MKLQLKSDYFHLENSKIELISLIFYALHAVLSLAYDMGHDLNLTFKCISTLFVLLRCKKRTFFLK